MVILSFEVLHILSSSLEHTLAIFLAPPNAQRNTQGQFGLPGNSVIHLAHCQAI